MHFGSASCFGLQPCAAATAAPMHAGMLQAPSGRQCATRVSGGGRGWHLASVQQWPPAAPGPQGQQRHPRQVPGIEGQVQAPLCRPQRQSHKARAVAPVWLAPVRPQEGDGTPPSVRWPPQLCTLVPAGRGHGLGSMPQDPRAQRACMPKRGGCQQCRTHSGCSRPPHCRPWSRGLWRGIIAGSWGGKLLPMMKTLPRLLEAGL